MVVEVYDSFLDPANWPDEFERARLVRIYGWPDLAPPQHPWVQAAQRQETPPMQHTDGAKDSGAPSTIRTCDSLRRCVAIAQPTTFRLQASRTTTR